LPSSRRGSVLKRRMDKGRPVIDGILNLNKFTDATSMDMVRIVKRLTRVKHVGHAGTLDPIATGVLPICFGQATRLMEHLVDGIKGYRAEVTLGVATDTYDVEGTVVGESDPSAITRSQVEALLPVFLGSIQQQPPMYSALKHEGKRLYALARAGVEVERSTREVWVGRLELLEWSLPTMSIEAECGRGFYMRTLAQDIGTALGCGAHLSKLVRLRTGSMDIEEAVSMEEFEAAVNDGSWEHLLEPPDAAVKTLSAISVGQSAEHHLRNGQPVSGGAPDASIQHLEARRAYSGDGRFLGLVRFNRAQNQWQPEKLFDLPLPSRYAPSQP
jgi:tRNA pseudouridine55 synthase